MNATSLSYPLAEKSHVTYAKLGTMHTHVKCVLATIVTTAGMRFHVQVVTCFVPARFAGRTAAAESVDFNFTWMMTQKGSSASHVIPRKTGTSFLVYTHMHMYMSKYPKLYGVSVIRIGTAMRLNVMSG